jgi:two-component system, LytTR family, response regulator
MKKYRLLIVDDEPLIRAGIRDGLSSRPEIEVAGESGSVTEAVEVLRTEPIDIVLLDVELPDGTGFDVIRRIGTDRMPVVVFVTAYDRYAVQAFEVNAVDYLLKPFDQRRLVAAMERANGRLADPAQALAQRLDALIQAREAPFPHTLIVRTEDRFDFVPVASLDWIEAANNCVVLHCGQTNHVLSESMTSLESRLDPAQFLRVHRSTIVNFRRISAVHTMLGGAYELELRGGSRIKTGRQYRDKIRKLLGG